MQIVLASRSPRRQELLRLIAPQFTVLPSDFDESELMQRHLSPRETVEALSRGKAEAVFASLHDPDDTVVIGGDTVVVSPDDAIFGIPANHEEAFAMIRALSGVTHQVLTGVTLCKKGKIETFSVATDVTFYPLTDEEIERYLQTGESYDKAGGYGIQGYGGLLVQSISGDYHNVVGLPVATLARKLINF